jgi:hypothetical protein
VVRWFAAAGTAAAPRRLDAGAAHLLRALLLRGRAFDRIPAALGLLDRASPGTARAVSRRLYGLAPLALAASGIEFLDYGSGGTVFLLRTPAGARVLKVYRRSLGRPLAEQREVARYYAERYRTVAGWYAGAGPVVTPSAFAVLPGPILGRTVAAVIQPYVAGRKLDFFEDATEDEMLSRLRADAALARSFRAFADRTLALFAQGERCLDLVGRENLMILEEGAHARLAIVDFGVFELPALRSRAPERWAALAERIDRLGALRRRLG